MLLLLFRKYKVYLYFAIGIIVLLVAARLLFTSDKLDKVDVLTEVLKNEEQSSEITNKYVDYSRADLVRMLDDIPTVRADSSVPKRLDYTRCHQARQEGYRAGYEYGVLEMVPQELRTTKGAQQELVPEVTPFEE